MRFTPPPFVPHPLLRNPHAMTIAPAFLPRALSLEFVRGGERRLFSVAEDAKVVAHCHWQPNKAQTATLIVVHGLEGSSESSHVVMVAQKAFASGMNVIRMNLRNCGGSMELSRTLYNAGLSNDLLAVAEQLRLNDRLQQIYAVGFSLGGNIVLKAAGEQYGMGVERVNAVVAVSPSIDLELCVQAIERPVNRVYELWFLRTLKQKIKEKARLFPEMYDVSFVDEIRTLRGFDDAYTAPNGGYGRVSNYYRQASALRVIENIHVPSLVIAAEDDPLVPFSMFRQPEMNNPYIELLSTKHGGHAGFVAKRAEDATIFDRYWAENRIIGFCQEVANRRKIAH